MLKQNPYSTKYLVRNKVVLCIFAFFEKLAPFFQKNVEILSPKKILLACPAHLGDVILATTCLKALKKEYPNVQIGFLVGSWGSAILAAHPYVDFIHTVDHWKMNRSQVSLLRKFFLYLQSFRKALREVREKNYDIAIDLYLYFPSSAYFFFRAKIKHRLGYTSGGFAFFHTHALDYRYVDQPVAIDLCKLLVHFGVLSNLPNFFLPSLFVTDHSWRNKISFSDKTFIIIHMGSGLDVKQYPRLFWQELVAKLSILYPIVFTGKGEQEKLEAQIVSMHTHQFVNVVDQLSLDQLISVVAHAKALISVDTSIGHIASCFNISHIALYTGIAPIGHFQPTHASFYPFLQRAARCPCFRRQGGSCMECKETSVDAVVNALAALIAHSNL